jgi:hypothetical protein
VFLQSASNIAGPFAEAPLLYSSVVVPDALVHFLGTLAIQRVFPVFLHDSAVVFDFF